MLTNLDKLFWNQLTELATGAGLSGVWDQFLDLSGWTLNNAGQWNLTAPDEAFAEAHGKTNPFEDFATSWEVYFSGEADQVSNATLQAKLDLIDSTLQQI